MGFVHLHCHSEFSILDGTTPVAALAKAAAAEGMPALALTDTANLYGAVAFYKACKGLDPKVRAVVGAELNVQPEGLEHADPQREEGGFQVVVLVENQQGYENLCALITDGIFTGMHYKPRVSLEQLIERRDGLIILTGGYKGLFGRGVLSGQRDAARGWFQTLVEAWDADSLFVELCDHGLPKQDEILAFARECAAEWSVPTVVTNAVHYLKREIAPVHEALNAISAGCSLSDERRVIAPTDQAWFKTEAEMRALFPDDGEAIERTVAIAERCDFHYDFDTYHFPAATPPDTHEGADTDANWEYFYRAYPPPRDYGMPDPEVAIPPRPEGAGNINGFFRWYAHEGLKLRLERIDPSLHEEYRQRLEFELDIVIEMGFPAYLLIVAEFINWSKDNEIPVGPGRGSAAGSLAAYAMRITDIDPIRFGLLFERFLNPERVSMPDIDVDFCQDRREEAIEHVRVKYGAPLVSQIITYGKLKAKAAVRDVSRVLDLNFGEADRIAKLIPDDLKATIPKALNEVEQLQRLYEMDPKVRRVLDTAMAVEGRVRQTGVHAAGVVIADQPLVKYAPLYRDSPEGGPVVQYDMKSAESIGLIKFDFLGLKTLDQIRDAVFFVEENYGIRLQMDAIPVDDAKTYKLLQRGDALGVFQLESEGMRRLLLRLKPSDIDDMVALVALYRPGPLESGMVDQYVERKHGRQDVSYPLDMLEPILKGTYGTMIYQEQVMQVAQTMASYSLGGADLLRRAMGKKIAAEMEKQRGKFVDGSVGNGISAEKANEVFDLMAKFAAYGFNKSHSAAYGYIAYQTAYLKAHYRPEYMAALMTIEAANTDKVLAYIDDCRQAEMHILPACVNHSFSHFSVPRPEDRPKRDDGSPADVVRFGLRAIKNVGSGPIDAIVEARTEAGGQFKDAMDFFERLDYRKVNRRVLENLVKAGALDCFGVARAALLEGLAAATTLAAKRQADKLAGQTSLFAMMAPSKASTRFRFPDVPEWPITQKLSFERDVLGLFLTGHPMQSRERDVARYASVPIHQLEAHDGEEVRLLGLVGELRVTKTRRGDKMAVAVLEDDRATVRCVFFPDAYQRSQRALSAGEPILVSGTLERDGRRFEVKAGSAEPLTEVRARTTRRVQFHLEVHELEGVKLDQFKQLLDARSGGCDAEVVLKREGRFEATLSLGAKRVEPSAALEEGVNALFGRTDVVALG